MLILNIKIKQYFKLKFKNVITVDEIRNYYGKEANKIKVRGWEP